LIKPLNIAHRGGADLWPENTLEAFSRAIELGVDGIEFDVQLSADGHLVIHHDRRMKAEATRLKGVFLKKPTPPINALNLAALQTYDVGRLEDGSHYAARRAGRAHIDGASIPTLAAFDALLTQTKPDFHAYMELKTNMIDAAQAAALAAAYGAARKISPVADKHIVISFDWRTVNAVRALFPDMPHAYTTMAFAETDPTHESAARDKPDSLSARLRQASKNGAPWWDGMDWRDMDGATHGERVLRAIKAGGGAGWLADAQDVTAENMAIAHDLGLSVSAWTVNDAAAMEKMAQLGVAAIITDRPDILKKL
jgi:glycerophosphoryl diester phosphodiesterase